MGSLRHNKMQQAGAKNGVKQTRLSMARQETEYSTTPMDYKGLLEVNNTYNEHLSNELKSFTPEQLKNSKRNDTVVKSTKFNSNLVPIDKNTNYDPNSNMVNKGINSNLPTLGSGGATISTYSVNNKLDPSLNRSSESNPPKAEFNITSFTGNVKNRAKINNSPSSNTNYSVFSKPTNKPIITSESSRNASSVKPAHSSDQTFSSTSAVQPISSLEYNANQRRVGWWNDRKKLETNN